PNAYAGNRCPGLREDHFGDGHDVLEQTEPIGRDPVFEQDFAGPGNEAAKDLGAADIDAQQGPGGSGACWLGRIACLRGHWMLIRFLSRGSKKWTLASSKAMRIWSPRASRRRCWTTMVSSTGPSCAATRVSDPCTSTKRTTAGTPVSPSRICSGLMPQ